MPELPEVEVIARGLDLLLRGQTIEAVEVLWPGAIATPAPAAFAASLLGRRFLRVGRRGKFLVLSLDDGRYLMAHLRMTGTFCVAPAERCPERFVRVVFRLANGWQLQFADMRKFGRLYLVDQISQATGVLGPEPLGADFTPEQLGAMLAGRRSAIKPLLLNQRFIAGLGNIYVDEALFRAGIHPLRCASSLIPEEVCRLWEAIQTVLSLAISHHGTTLSAYRDAEGRRGENQNHLLVYGRKGESCARCGGIIQRIVVSQRGTHFCPRCQPAA